MRRIVFTGGPGAGKSVLTRRLAEQFPHQFLRVPEAATQYYSSLATRWDRLNEMQRRAAQRQIYELQIEQESRLLHDDLRRDLVLDRGTLDGAAYWPQGAADYWRELNTTEGQELSRYDVVIWLESCAVLGLYDGDASNACRFEDSDAAIHSGKQLLKIWGGHSHLYRVPAFDSIEQKQDAIIALLKVIH